ncbi:MAG: DUF58 domain-containing protein, partial [Pseudomonadota bacterium]
MNSATIIPGISVDVEDLVRVRSLISEQSFRKIQRRSSYRSGAREARIRGRGMEYEETRGYISGDDVRTMDWRVMARTGEAHTKTFSEERERRFLIAIDLSAGMFFGTRHAFKSRAASITAAHVGWLASFTGARIGGVLVTPSKTFEIKPEKTRSGLMSLFHHLADASRIPLPPKQTSNRLNQLLNEIIRVAKPGTVVALISDFIGIDDNTFELVSGIARHCDINLFWIHDEIETKPWNNGHYQILSGQSSFGIEVTHRHVFRIAFTIFACKFIILLPFVLVEFGDWELALAAVC